jgi:hypothetical protein
MAAECALKLDSVAVEVEFTAQKPGVSAGDKPLFKVGQCWLTLSNPS